MKRFNILFFLVLVLGLSSCYGDLDTVPLDPEEITSATVYDNPESYKQVLAKLYAGQAVSGQEGPAGQPDIAGIDEGFGQYLRGYWYHQELSTDEAIIGWNDQTIKDFHDQSWSAGDGFIYAFYSRIFYQVALANEFLRETTAEKLDERNVNASLREEIAQFRAEARFLRALSYWHGLDLFRNTPFATEENVVGGELPMQISANDLFSFIETELIEIETELAAPRTLEYGRADQAAAWTLLAKLYLNAEVYINEGRYDLALTYCKRVLDAGFELDAVYQNLFLADNHLSPEIIFPVSFDGLNTRTYGGTTFIIRAGIGGAMDPEYSGVSSGWGGTRTTKELVNKFPKGGGTVIDLTEGNTKNYPQIYVPGSHNDFVVEDTENSISSPNSDNVFEGYKYFPTDNGSFKIYTIPSASAPYFGDNDGDGVLDQFGADINVGSAGLYFIQVDFNNATYTVERQNWGFVGSATPNGSTPTALNWNPDENRLEANADLANGMISFVNMDNPSQMLNDENGDGILSSDEAPFEVTKSGGYLVVLDLDKPDYSDGLYLTSFDRRAMFFSDGQSLEINDVTLFTDGYAVNKFRNVTSSGVLGSDVDFPDTDFPMFRLADVYLMAAEAILRGANGSIDEAADYFNAVRERAYTGTAGNVAASNLDLPLILEERARELYWECHRRTDLVRFGQFTDGDYTWEWKGGSKEGIAVEAFRNIYPIPDADKNANPNLEQNPGY